MLIRFGHKKLQKQCSDMPALVKRFGAENARVIARRLGALAAYPTLADVPITKPERCHALTGDLVGHFAVDAQHPFRVVFAPDHDPLPRKRDGGLDLHAVTEICIVDILDYH